MQVISSYSGSWCVLRFNLGALTLVSFRVSIDNIIKRHGLQYHLYADDMHLYVSFKTDSSDNLQIARSKVELCVQVRYIDIWMLQNGLKLNQEKSEMLVLTLKFRASPELVAISVVDEHVKPESSAGNLGELFDTYLSLNGHEY